MDLGRGLGPRAGDPVRLEGPEVGRPGGPVPLSL